VDATDTPVVVSDSGPLIHLDDLRRTARLLDTAENPYSSRMRQRPLASR
jgi:hypothetical protein